MKTAKDFIAETCRKNNVESVFDLGQSAIEDMMDSFAQQSEKKWADEDMKECFNESRLTHPMIGFKHTTFKEYLQTLKQQP
jgi:hypothetical protein